MQGLPQHLAVIMDGNGRWARARALPRQFGHRRGSEKLYEFSKWCVSHGVRYLTVYAFSTENWQRSEEEVKALLNLLPQFLDKHEAELKAERIRVKLFGDLSRLEPKLRQRVEALIADSREFDRLDLNICFSYGARDELVRTIRKLAASGQDLSQIDENSLSLALDSAGIPDPDLLIRTGGELRLSNFLLWQLAYTELYFTDKLWPDFTEADLIEAFNDYKKRQRRFGRR
ncbi:MAG: polyprenyl diphosphate synthase [Eubacteriales bacterium]|nr:polyprenyl diphosphate synthase [Eubacteriales bacterium]